MCAQLRLTLCNTIDCSLPGSSVHAILQARILEWVAIFSSRGSSQPRDQTHVSCIGWQILYYWATSEVHIKILSTLRKIQFNLFNMGLLWSIPTSWNSKLVFQAQDFQQVFFIGNNITAYCKIYQDLYLELKNMWNWLFLLCWLTSNSK